MIWGIISLILLIIVIGLTIWLLVRQSGSCPTGKSLNQECSTTSECNSGLICSSGSGSAITASNGTNTDTTQTCKVAFGGVCSAASECASGQTCTNGVCTIALGTGGRPCPCDIGFTCVNNVCLAISGEPCNDGTNCASGMCQNNVCVVDNCNNTDTNCYTSDSSCDRRTSDSLYTDSSRDLYTCTDSDCSKTRYSYTSGSLTRSKSSHSLRSRSSDSLTNSYKSPGSKHHDYKTYSFDDSECSYKDKSFSHSFDSTKHSSDSFDSSKHTDSEETSDCSRRKHKRSDSSGCSPKHGRKYIRKGVYVTTQNNMDSTMFADIDKPIIDIAKHGSGFLLLLSNGNVVISNGSTKTKMMTNKQMFRMVRFGTEIIGLDHRGKLYSQNKEGSNANFWSWEHLRNYPSDVVFINSTNTWNNLEVITCRDKALLYTFNSSNWKEGNSTSKRRTKDFRYYGKDLNRYIDIEQRKNIGKTNDGAKYKGIKAAGFYNTGANGGEIVQVLCEDTFTHVRIIDNKSYFIFEQNC